MGSSGSWKRLGWEISHSSWARGGFGLERVGANMAFRTRDSGEWLCPDSDRGPSWPIGNVTRLGWL